MDYANGFILQKTMVSTNRSVDWSLLRSSSTRLLPARTCSLARARKGLKNPRFNRKKFHFEFVNGEVMRPTLYEHLKVG
jgi:hypothetical protein